MGGHGVEADAQGLGNLAVALARGQKAQYLDLARTEVVEESGVGVPGLVSSRAVRRASRARMPSSRAVVSASCSRSMAFSRSPGWLRARSITAYWYCVWASQGRAPMWAFMARASSKCCSASSQRDMVAASMPDSAPQPHSRRWRQPRLCVRRKAAGVVQCRRTGRITQEGADLGQVRHAGEPEAVLGEVSKVMLRQVLKFFRASAGGRARYRSTPAQAARRRLPHAAAQSA